MMKEYLTIRVQRVSKTAFNAYMALNLSPNPLPFEFCAYEFIHRDGYIVYVSIDDTWTKDELKRLIHMLIERTYPDDVLKLAAYHTPEKSIVKSLSEGIS